MITGTIGALVVPMLGFLSSQSPNEPGDTTYIGDIQTSDDDITKHLADFINHVGDYHNLATSYNNHVDESNKHVNNYENHVNIYARHLPDHDVADLLIEVDASDTYLVRVPPQIWYRTELRQGDTFWALPDANFNIVADKLIFTPVENANCSDYNAVVKSTESEDFWESNCKLTSATLNPSSEKYNISDNLRFKATGDGIEVDYFPSEKAEEDGEEPVTIKNDYRANFDYEGRKATHCTFDLIKFADATPENKQICVWLRNSGDPEGRVGAVAFDVKWESFLPRTKEEARRLTPLTTIST